MESSSSTPHFEYLCAALRAFEQRIPPVLAASQTAPQPPNRNEDSRQRKTQTAAATVNPPPPITHTCLRGALSRPEQQFSRKCATLPPPSPRPSAAAFTLFVALKHASRMVTGGGGLYGNVPYGGCARTLVSWGPPNAACGGHKQRALSYEQIKAESGSNDANAKCAWTRCAFTFAF